MTRKRILLVTLIVFAMACHRAAVVAPDVDAGRPAGDASAPVVLGPLAPEEPARVSAGTRLSPLVWTPVDGTPLRVRGVTLFTSEALSPEELTRRDASGAYLDSAFEDRRCDLRRRDATDVPRCVPVDAPGDVESGALVRLVDLQVEPGGPGFVLTERRFSDGTVEQRREPETACGVRLTTDGHRCVPRDLHVAGAPGFVDRDCTQRGYAAGERLRRMGPGELFGAFDDDGVLELLEVEERRTGRLYERLEDGTCAGATPQSAVWVRARPADLTRVPRLTPTPVGTGRLRPIRWLDDAGRAWSTVATAPDAATADFGGLVRFRTRWEDRFFDRELGIECTPWETPDGLRCLPPVPQDEEWFFGGFADDACTSPVALRVFPARGFTRAPEPMAVVVTGEIFTGFPDGSPPPVTVRAVGAERLDVETIYVEGGEACTVYELGRLQTDVRSAGDIVPLTRFAPLLR